LRRSDAVRKIFFNFDWLWLFLLDGVTIFVKFFFFFIFFVFILISRLLLGLWLGWLLLDLGELGIIHV